MEILHLEILRLSMSILLCSGLDRIAISGIESSGIVIPTVYIFQEGTKTVYSLSLNKDSFPQGGHGKD